jgi:hypothetical protein
MINIIHSGLSNATVLYFLFGGLYGLYRAIRKQGVDGNYFGIVAIGGILFLAQGVIGGILFAQGAAPVRSGLHILYGIFNIILLPFVYGYTRGDDSNTAQWMYAFSMLFLFGTALRTIQTGV